MAGTRMYLFDLCERLFANRHEMLAQSLRAQLREARDLAARRCAAQDWPCCRPCNPMPERNGPRHCANN